MKRRKKQRPANQPLQLESLESRLLLSADGLLGGLQNPWDDAQHQNIVADAELAGPAIIFNAPAQGFDSLASQLAATGTPAAITASQKARILSGLADLKAWFDTWGDSALMQQDLPLTGQSLDDMLDPGALFQQRVVTPLTTYLNSTGSPTTDGLNTAIAGLGGTFGPITFTITPGSTGGGLSTGAQGEQLTFGLAFTASKSLTLPLDLRAGSSQVPVRAESSANLNATATFVFDGVFGIELNPAIADGADFFIQVNDLKATGSVAMTGANFSLEVGFLDVGAQNANLNLTAQGQFAFLNPDGDSEGKITNEELTSRPVAELLTPVTTGSLSVDAPLHLSGVAGLNLNGDTHLLITGDPWNSAAITKSLSGPLASALLDFRASDPSVWLGALRSVGQWLSNLAGRPEALARAVPLTNNATLAQLLDLSTKFQQTFNSLQLAQPNAQGERFTFSTLQELTSQVATALGQPAATEAFAYNPATRKLSWNVLAAYSNSTSQALSLGNVGAGSVAGISTSAQVTVNVQGNVGFTIIADLNPLTAVVNGTVPLPASGALTAQATMVLQRGSGEQKTVSIPAAPGNTTRAQLIGQINAALTTAGLSDVVASDVGGVLRLTLTAPGDATLSLTTEAGNAARTQLGLPAAVSVGESLAQRLALSNVTMGASATLTGSAISAAAKFGFVSLNTTGGTLNASAAVTMAVRDPGAPAAPLTAAQFSSVLNAPGTYLAAPVLTGNATLVLQGLTVQGSAIPGMILGASPSLTLTLPDVFNPGTGSLAVNGLGALERFSQLNGAGVASAFSSVGAFLNTIAGTGALNIKLPGINRTLGQLINFGGALQPAISALTSGAPVSLQELQSKLQTAFAAAGTAIPGFSLVPAISIVGNDLRMDVNVRISRTLSQSFELKLGDFGGSPFIQALGSLVNLGASLTGTATIDLKLKFGLDLTNVASPRFFVDESSSLTAEARAAISPLNFSAGVGPLNVAVVNGSAVIGQAGNSNPVSVVLGLSNSGGSRVYLDTFNTSLLEVTSTSGVGTVTLPVTYNGAAIPGAAGSSIIVTIPLNGTAPTFTVPDFEGLITGSDLFTTSGALKAGLDYLFDKSLGLLKTQFGSIKLPFVGGKLGDAFDFIGALKANFATLGSATSLTNAQSLLWTALSGSGLLLDTNGAGGVTIDDVIITPATTPGAPVSEVTMEFLIGKQHTTSFNFDIGLAALPLHFNSNMTINLSLEYEWRIKIGLNKTEGFFLVTDGANELHAEVSATLASGSSASVELGLLAGELSAPDNSTAISGALDINLRTTDGNNHLTVQELLSGGFAVDVNYGLNAHVFLQLAAGISSGNGVDEQFPRVTTALVVDWPIAGANAAGSPTVTFSGLQFDAGQFIKNLLGPYIEVIHDVFEPLGPILDFLNFNLPLANKRVIDLLALLGPEAAAASKLVDIAIEVNELYNLVKPFLDGAAGGGLLNAGSATFGAGSGIDWSNPGFDFAGFNIPGGSLSLGNLTGALRALSGQINDLFSGIDGLNAAGDTSGFRIPILEDPAKLFGLLLGKDVTLIEYDMPAIDFSVSSEILLALIPIPPVPVPLSLKMYGAFSFHADYTFGYDTYGLRKIIDGAGPEAFFDGFYILNAPGAETNIRAELGIQASLDVFIFEVGVQGGLEGVVMIDLVEPEATRDGKLRWEEIEAQGLLCSLQFSGAVNFVVNAFVTIDLWIASKTFTVNLVSIPLLTFDFGCDPNQPPNLASIDAGTGTLTLNTGSRAGNRRASIQGETEESYVVEPGPQPGSVVVKAFGFTETYGPGGIGGVPVTAINGDFGSDKDSFLMNPELAIPLNIRGGDGDDSLRGGSGPNNLYGDAGNDVLFGGAGNDVLDGGIGEDQVYGGAGNDELHGGDGNDILSGEEGNDTHFAGPGNDTVEAGLGDDFVDGGDGDDAISGGDGSDTLHGGSGADEIFGHGGNDFIYGNTPVGPDETAANRLYGDFQPGSTAEASLGIDGSDTIAGSGGADEIYGGGGNDIIDARGGQDYVEGGAGNDTIQAGAGVDYVIGEAGDDQIYGGSENDNLIGGSGNDLLDGGAGNDTLRGQSGNDTIYGQAGGDLIYGDEGIDTIDGGDDIDLIFGFSGADNLSGGAGADLIRGGSEGDFIYGNGGADSLYGESGADSIYGGTENDYIDGGTGNDTIRGEAGIDTIFGQSGADNIGGGTENDVIHGGTENDTIAGDAGADTINGNEGDDIITGGTEADVIHGNAGNDTISGDDGDDILFGETGMDVIHGNAGSDVITGNEDDDVITGGTEADVIHGNAGNDSISGDDGDDTLFGETGMDVIHGNAGSDVITGNEDDDVITGGTEADVIHGNAGADHISGDDGNDLIYGDTENDTIFGNAGDDTIEGNDGSDIISGGTGADVIRGNAGEDTLTGDDGNDFLYGDGQNDNISGNAGDDVIEGNDGADTIHGNTGNDIILGHAGTDQLFGDEDNDQIFGGTEEDIIEGGSGNDTIQGNEHADVIKGGSGMDNIHGNDGDDVIDGDADDDTIFGDAGADLIHGNDGADTIQGNDGTDTIHGDAGADNITGNQGEDLIYGGTGNDSIYGGTENDVIHGGDDDDTIEGNEHDDTVYAGTGNDNVLGQAGLDHLYGESGNDTISGGDERDVIYGGAGVDILAGDAADDLIYGEAGADTITGGTGNDIIDAGDDADAVSGNEGDDRILGGRGADVLSGDAGSDFIDGGGESDTIHGNEGDDTLLAGDGLGGIISGDDGNDTIYGSDGVDTITGDAGSDRIQAFGGNDVIDGGSGDDVIDASDGDDTVHGSDGLDTIYGGAGADVLYGEAGRDRLFGEAGADSLDGGDDADALDGGSGADLIHGGLGDDEILGGGGTGDQLFGDAGDDVIRGSNDGADFMDGGEGDDRLYGMGGNDTIMGGLGMDEIDGGAGDDLIEGGAGADTIIGGANHDTVYGHSASGAGDDNTADVLYGDFGTNGNEPGSGGDRLYGQGGNDVLFGEGGDDLLVTGAGSSHNEDYGSGESGTPSAFVPPAGTANPAVQPDPSNPRAAANLPTGPDDGWFWAELARSATAGGVSGAASLARDAVVAIAASGAVFVAWADTRKGNYEIYLARYLGGAWTMLSGSAENGGLSNSAASSRTPSLAIDSTGQPVVAWVELNANGTSDIRAARYDGSAWAALGTSLGAAGLSGTGAARDPQVVIYNNTPVVTWVDASSGSAQVYAKQFTGGLWTALGAASGTGISVTGSVRQMAAAASGTKLAVAWSSPAGGVDQISVREWSGTAWVNPGGLTELSSAPDGAANPALSWQGSQLFVAWESRQPGAQEIKARHWNGSSWSSIQQVSTTTGLASTPKLASNGTKTVLTWLDQRPVDPADFYGRESLYAKTWNGSAFVEEVAGEASGGGVARAVEAPHSLAVALDSAGTIQTVWSEDVSSGISLIHRQQPLTVRVQSPVETLSGILSSTAFGPRSIITLRPGSHLAAAAGANDAGVVILGADDLTSTVSGLTADASYLTMRGVALGAATVNATGFGLRDVRLTEYLTLGAGSSSIVRTQAQPLRTVSFTSATGTIEVRSSQLGSIQLATAGGGEIFDNLIQGTLTVAASFSGSIRQNVITNPGGRAVDYNAPAAFTGNIIRSSGTGVEVLAGQTFGMLGGQNTITGNTTGVNLQNSAVRGQLISNNGTGIAGSGYAGGADWSSANRIEGNFVGISITGEAAFNILSGNTTGIVASSGQLIRNNVISRIVSEGISIPSNISGVRISFNTLYVQGGRGVTVFGSEVEFTNNVLWAEGPASIGLWLKDSGPSGFWSDYNLLHGTAGAAITHWTMPFTDILDWQQDVFRYDLHSQGSGTVNPNLFRPRVASVARDDFQPLEMLGSLRLTQPLVDAGDARLDPLINRNHTNLLTNPRFESALTGWTVSPAATGAGGFFSAAGTDTGFAYQTVSLLSAGFSAAQLDGFDFYAVFGGRVRTSAEALADLGTVKITFLDTNGAAISTVTQPATLATDRWETTGGRVLVPAGTRQITYRFEADERTASNNDARLDDAFLYIVPDSVAPDQGAWGLTASDAAAVLPQLKLRGPDLYRDWEANKPLLIEWDSFANAAESTVKIDLYQDSPAGPAFLLTINPATVDNGSYLWIPANSGITAGTHGLRIHISLNGQPQAWDRSSETFSVPENGAGFFANDRSVLNDELTSAAGSNRNTGRTAASPKPGVAQLLRIYQIGSGQTLSADTGEYRSFQPLVLSGIVRVGDDEGFTFTGPADPARIALLRYAVPGAAGAVLRLDDADFMTIRRLSLQGGGRGLEAVNGSLSLTAANLTMTGASGAGFHLDASSSAIGLTNISAINNGGRGVELLGVVPSLAGGTISGNGAEGLYMSGTGSIAVSGLNVLNNVSYGIYANQSFGLTTGISGSIVSNNGSYGIYGGYLSVSGNVVSGHTVAGIYGYGASTVISGNVIDGNRDGIFAADSITILNNRIYRQTDRGIRSSGNATISGNVIYSNLRGLDISNNSTLTVSNNLIYDNDDYGVRLSHSGAGTLTFTQNTVHSGANSAILLVDGSNNTAITNNIIWVTGGNGISVPPSAETGFSSNFNLFYTTGSGTVGRWQNSDRVSLASWRAANFADSQSVQQNPQFVDADGADNLLGYVSAANDGRDDDFHLQSPHGSFKGGSTAPTVHFVTGLPVALTGVWSNDAVFSPGIDRGAPASPFSNEPSPNGGFANIGHDGNTAAASKSPLTWLLVTSPDGGETVPATQTVDITWRSHDTAGNVLIELLPSAGGATTLAASTANDGSFLWTVPQAQTPGSYTIRITRLDGPVLDSSNASFSITAPVTQYYVNDSTVTAGDWTTVAGNDANDGLDPARPKASIRAILQTYDLGPGDIILVDNGTYTVSANILMAADDSGVTIRGFKDAAQPGKSAVLNRGNTSGYVFEFTGADDVIIEDLTLQGGGYGIFAASGAGSAGVTVRGNLIQSNSSAGIGLRTSNNNWTISGNTIRGQAGPGLGQQYGVDISGPSNFVISGNTLSLNTQNALYLGGANILALENSVTSSSTGIYAGSYTDIVIRRNTVFSNVVSGIYTEYAGSGNQTLVEENTIYGHTTSSGYGINANYSTLRRNVIYNNLYGIQLRGPSGLAVDNDLRNNVTGIFVSAGGFVQGNRIYSNQTGVEIGASSDSTRVFNNLIYANATRGIWVANGGVPLYSEIRNNTIWQISGDAVRATGNNRGIHLLNNLFHVEAGFALNVDSGGQNGFISDFNLFDITGTGNAANWGGAIASTWLEWRLDRGYDTGSVSANPLMGDIDGADDILGGTGSADDNFRPLAGSPTTDAGDPNTYFLAEPGANGGRVNIGHTGNTAQALTSDPRVIQILNPNGYERIESGTVTTVPVRTWGFGSTLPLVRMDAGSSSGGDGWMATDYTGWQTSSGSVSGVIDMTNAPAGISEAALRSYTWGTGLTFNLPLPDGSYSVQLTNVPDVFGVNQDVSDIFLNGTLAADNYDTFAAAGGRLKVAVLNLNVTVTGGNGLQIKWTGVTGTPKVSTIGVTAVNPAGVAAPAVSLEYSSNSGASWSPVAGGQNITPDARGMAQIPWTVPGATPGRTGMLRASALTGTVTDVSDNAFTVVNAGNFFYVNDGSLTGDVFTTSMGSNLNDGKSPETPMAGLAAILAAYDFEPGDVIHLDTGNYVLPQNLLLTLQDSGVTIKGPDSGTGAVITRGGDINARAFELSGITSLTLENLRITGSGSGIYAASGNSALNLTVRGSTLFNNSSYGIYLDSSASLTVQNSEFYGTPGGNGSANQSYGISASTGQLSVSGSHFHHLSSTGVSGSALSGSVTANLFNNLSSGIYLSGQIEAAGNTVTDFSSIGIFGNSIGVVVRNNTVTRGTTSNTTGIDVWSGGGNAFGNTVSLTATGIRTYGGIVANNRVFGNSVAGISGLNAVVRNNTVYSNGVGIDLTSNGPDNVVVGNLVYANTSGGIRMSTNSGSTSLQVIENNTVYQSGAAAVAVSQVQNTIIRNNILWVDGAAGVAISVAADSQRGFISNYNGVYLTGGAKFGQWQGISATAWSDWTFATGADRNSRTGNPMFVDVDGADNLLGYTGGADRGADDNFLIQAGSLTIDAGDPSSAYYGEPSPAGGRVNMGHTGNTPLAAAGLSGPAVWMISPNGYEKFETGQSYPVLYRSSGFSAWDVVGLYDVAGVRATGNWQSDTWQNSPYYIGNLGSTPVNVTGVADPASQAVYQTYIIQPSGTTGLDWNFAAADGTYRLRLHFVDSHTQSNQRVFDVSVNGVLAADNYDIAAAAGNVAYKATVLDIATTASGGSGIQLRLADVIGDATISGIEILRANPLAPPGATTYQLDFQSAPAAAWVRQTGAGLSETGYGGYGAFTWTAGSATDGNTARLRVVASNGSTGTSVDPFLIANDGKNYYINDSGLTGDEFTTAAGSDFNSGKSPDQPMANLMALLEAYNLDPDDVIYLDTGAYAVWRDITWTANDSGARLQGPLNGGIASLNRGNATIATTVLRIDGADDVSVTRVRLTGAEEGVRVLNDADGFRLTYSEISGNRTAGVEVATGGNDNVYIADNTLFGIPGGIADDNQSYGIILNSSNNTSVLRNRLYDGTATGIEVNGGSSFTATVSGNKVSNFSSHGIGFYTAGTLADNEIYDNGGNGISFSGTGVRTVTGNTVYRHLSSGAYGISGGGSERITNNTVYQNNRGIYGYSLEVSGNRVFGNINAGIEVLVSERITGNFIYSNGTGVELKTFSASASVTNNLIYSNTNYGILITSPGGNTSNRLVIANNTIDQPVGDAIRITSSNAYYNLVNNIINSGTGYGIFVQNGAGTGLVSDRNLFFHNGAGGSFVGQRGGVNYATLSAWQAGTSLDALSSFADPLFVDRNGQDNLSGFAVATGDSGRDDNYYLLKNSPAIDRGDGLKGTAVDLFGQIRVDDPSTANAGGTDYFINAAGSSSFAATGTSLNLRNTRNYVNYNFTGGFTFSLYGQTYTRVYVTTEGFLAFGDTWQQEENNSAAYLASTTSAIVAPLWDNLTTAQPGGDVFVDASVAGQVTFRWAAALQSDVSKTANFSVTLFSNGHMRFNYGAGNTGLTPTVGFSSGTGNVRLTPYDGSATLTNANSLDITTGPSIIDLGALEFAGSGADVTPPVVTATTPSAVLTSGTTSEALFHLRLDFSEALNPVDANTPSNYELRSSGVNLIFGDADDIISPLQPVYTAGGTGLVLRIASGPLPAGAYRLTVSGDGLRDQSGNLLDGDNNGSAGGHFVRFFTIAPEATAPRITSVAVGRSTWSAAFRQSIDPGPGLGYRLDTGATQNTVIPFLDLDQISIVFSEHVTVNLAQIQLRNSLGLFIPVEKAVMDVITHTLTLTLAQPLGSAHYELSLTDAVTDAWGNALDGEWQDGVSLESGNGTAGGSFAMNFRVLEGDINGDSVTNDLDLFGVWQHIAGVPYNALHDLNGDGQIASSDVTLMSTVYLQALPSVWTLSGGLRIPVPAPLIQFINNAQP